MTQLTHNVIAVEVPDDAELFETSIQDDGIPCLAYYSSDNTDPTVECLPPGTYVFLFTTKNVTEEQAREVVKPQWMVQTGTTPSYPDYTGEWAGFVDQPIKSFESLLRSKNLDTKKNYAVIQKI